MTSPTKKWFENLLKFGFGNTDPGTLTGSWSTSTNQAGYYGINYIHDNMTGKGSKSVTFAPTFPVGGDYEVFARWTSSSNRADNVPMAIAAADGTHNVTLNEQVNNGTWFSLGVFHFNSGTTGTINYVIVDAVKFVFY